MEAFVNRSVKHRTGVQRSTVPLAMLRQIYGLLWRKMEQVNRDASAFRYFTPFHNIYEQAERMDGKSSPFQRSSARAGSCRPKSSLSPARE